MERVMKQIAVANELPVFQPENVNSPESLGRIQKTCAPEILVVAAYGQILSADLLQVPLRGGINVHSSLLPKYRGAAPIAWAIYNGETETGVTIIRMSPRMDAGEMLGQVKEPIRTDDTAGTLEARLAQKGADLALQVLDQVESGTEHGIPQDLKQVTKAPKLTKELGLIDFSKSAHQFDRQIRAFQPWPTAYTYWHRPNSPPMRIILVRAVADPTLNTNRPAGEVVAVQEDQLSIACGDGSVVNLLTLQPAGKKVLSIREFLRGYRVQIGERFGNS
jgi:methionyl-tRNA formyltransferase